MGADGHDAPVGDVGDGVGALTDAIVVETSDGDLTAEMVGFGGPKTCEGLDPGFEPETPPPLTLANETDDAEAEDNADPGPVAFSSSPRQLGRLLSPAMELVRSP